MSRYRSITYVEPIPSPVNTWRRREENFTPPTLPYTENYVDMFEEPMPRRVLMSAIAGAGLAVVALFAPIFFAAVSARTNPANDNPKPRSDTLAIGTDSAMSTDPRTNRERRHAEPFRQ